MVKKVMAHIPQRIVACVLVVLQLGIIHPLAVIASEPMHVTVSLPAAEGPSAAQMIRACYGGTVRLGSAEIKIPPGALAEDTEIRITRLWRTEATGEWIRNATAGGGGYRFQPSGTHFAVPVTIRMGYETGITESAKETLYTYFFDTESRRWEQLARVGIEGTQVISHAMHFTDMINGTLQLPEGPSPLNFNINSIKGLEAANPSAGVPGIQGLEANNTGAASFQIPIDLPPGRAGMTPQVAVTYSSDGGNGVMGRGFDLHAGGRITIDTRWGMPRFNSREANVHALLRDTYLLDGVMLELYPPGQNFNGNILTYRPLRESRHERIQRVIRSGGREVDYWIVTDRFGRQRIFGRSEGFWSGRNERQKFTWELEEERDLFGNTIRYRYEYTRLAGGGFGLLFLAEIIYTLHDGNLNRAAHSVRFEYETGRQDIRVDGRGGFAAITDRLLTGITVYYRGATPPRAIRRYRMVYEANMFGTKQMVQFGQLAVGGPDEFFWSYLFSYEELEGGMFDIPRRWYGIEDGLQVQSGSSSGSQGSVSGGLGVGRRNIDVRGHVGRTWSNTGNTTDSDHTFMDIDGDGRPDSVSVRGSTITIRRNNGAGFDPPVTVTGIGTSNIGRERSRTTASGLTYGGGVSFRRTNIGPTRSRTTQRGQNEAYTGFGDIDGDGRVDVIIGGANFFYRNVSRPGAIRFERVYFSAHDTAMPGNAAPPLSDEERTAILRELDETFFQQTPLREWRSPEAGVIRVEQQVTASRGTVSGDGIVARMFFRDAVASAIEPGIGSHSSQVLTVDAEESLFFLSDPRGDTRGDSIEWGITISYQTMRYFGSMDRRVRYVPPANHTISWLSQEDSALRVLYDRVYIDTDDSQTSHYVLSDRDWEEAVRDADRGERIRVWEEIIRRGWFVPGYIAAEQFEPLWETAGARDRGNNNDFYRQALIAYFLFHAGNNAYVRNEGFGETRSQAWLQAARPVSTLIRLLQAERGTFFFTRYTLQPENSPPIHLHPVPYHNDRDRTFAMTSGQQELGRRQSGYIGYIYFTGAGNTRRLILDIIDGRQWSVDLNALMSFSVTVTASTTEPVPNEPPPPPTVNIAFQDPFQSGTIRYYIDGMPSGQASVTQSGGRTRITIPINHSDGTLRYQMIHELSGFNWISADLPFDDIERMRTAIQGDMFTISHAHWHGDIASRDIESILVFLADTDDRDTFYNAFHRIPLLAPFSGYSYRLRNDLSEGELAHLDRILTSYGRHLFLTVQFPFYTDNGDGTFSLRPRYAQASFTAPALAELFAGLHSNTLLRESYQELIQKSIDFNLVHYAGVLVRSVIYYAGGMYAIEDNGGITVSVLLPDGDGNYRFTKRAMTHRATQWDSGRDFSNQYRQPLYDLIAGDIITDEELRNLLDSMGGLEELEGEEVVVPPDLETEDEIIGFGRVELLFGGVNRWYYAVWIGNQRDNPFRQHKLYDQQRTMYEQVNVQSSVPDAAQINNLVYLQVTSVAQANEAATLPGEAVQSQLRHPETGSLIESGALVGPVSRVPVFSPDGSIGATERTYFPYIYRNRIFTSRTGGLSYYETSASFIPSAPTPGGGVMPAVRRSDNEGRDRASNLALGVMMVNVGRNWSENSGSSRMFQSVQSLSGSGMADIVQALPGGRIRVTERSRLGFAEYHIIQGIRNINYNIHSTRASGSSIGASGSLQMQRSASGQPAHVIIHGGGSSGGARAITGDIGGSQASGTNRQTAGFIDINGDGLPDYFSNGNILMNFGRSDMRAEQSLDFTFSSLSTGRSLTRGSSRSIGLGSSGNVTASNIRSNIGVSCGINYSVSVMDTDTMLLDMNGDGLPDLVRAANGNLFVRFNLGNRFADEELSFPMHAWNDANISNLANTIDGQLRTGLFGSLPMVGNVNSFIYGQLFNALTLGIDFRNHINSLESNSTISAGVSASANVGVAASIPIPMTPIRINPNIGGGGGFNSGSSVNGVMVRMIDMDGDGLPDRVLRIPGTSYLLVQRNLAGRVGLLRSIALPQGGEYALDYEWIAGTQDMPQSRFVLSRLTRRDNSGRNGLFNPAFESYREYTVRFTYADGYFDRAKREFYGFRIVTTEHVDRNNRVLSRSQTVFHNRDYHLRGMSQIVTVYEIDTNSGRREVSRRSEFTPDRAPFARNVMERHETFEAERDGSRVFSESRFEHDRFGNVTRLTEESTGGERITAVIHYWFNLALHLAAHPQEMRVYGSQSGLLRSRRGRYDPATGALIELTQMLGPSPTANDPISTIAWDRYGNLQRITDRRGAFVEYLYDTRYRQHVVTILSGGQGIVPLRSYIEWDTAFGLRTRETDWNRNSIHYVYDLYGRLIEVWSPYDNFGQGGTTPAVRHSYHTPANGNWYAVTENKIQFDPSNHDTLTTVIMADGLGRVLYTAKQGEIWNNGNPLRGWNVSGFTAFDAQGRAAATGQPLFVRGEALSSLLNWDMRDRVILLNPTEREFDSLDRVVRTRLPAAAGQQRPEQRTRFAVRGSRTWTITTDPLGNITEHGRDGRGNITNVRRLDRHGTALTWATYRYDGLGQMLAVYDADGNPLTVDYDLLGRRTRMTSADIGVKEWWYDSAGNMIARRDSELARRGRRVYYDHDGLNRLVKIRFPFSQDITYEYGAFNPAGREDNAAGRITRITDESGTTSFEYGRLGQIVTEDRTIRLLPLSRNLYRRAVMRFTSNYLGQMQEIIFPDGEVVRYEYNHGGQVIRVTGTRVGTTFNYVNMIGYDEFSQRIFMELGNGVRTYYTYDPYRRWLATIRTIAGQSRQYIQNIVYEFDMVGNVLGYENNAHGYTTIQRYYYDALYQLIEARGESRSHPHGRGHNEFVATYRQTFTFDRIGNMLTKTSTASVSPQMQIGADLNYHFDYIYAPGTRRAIQIGNRFRSYDLNGNLIAERDGGFATNPEIYRPFFRHGDMYWAEYGFGFVRPGGVQPDDGVFQRNFRWNERNQLIESSDSRYTVLYRYGADGQRAIKFVANVGRTTLYFNSMWHVSDAMAMGEWVQSKHIFVGSTRIATKFNIAGNDNTQAELQSVYFYHTDHLGSAQTITNWRGELHERLEYTPYGELWIDWRAPGAIHATPFRFTGMEHDRETGLIYFGARYLDPRMSRWLSTDPAMWQGDFIPAPGQGPGDLRGLGGVFNVINLHVFNYAANNPIRYVDPDGEAIFLPLVIKAVITIAKSGGVSAAVSGTIDVGMQMNRSHRSTGEISIDFAQTGAAMAGGFIAGTITGGTGIAASYLTPLVARGATVLGGAVAGAADGATSTAINNVLNNRPITENMAENVVVGTVAGAVSGRLTNTPSMPFHAPSYGTAANRSATFQSVAREAGGELWQGVRDEIIQNIVREVIY